MQDHIHKANEKKCNSSAKALHRAPFTLSFFRGNVTPKRHKLAVKRRMQSRFYQKCFLFSSWSHKRSVITAQEQC